MKETLAFILFLLSMTTFVLLVIGFFNPGKALFWYNKPRTKKSAIIINGLVFIVAFTLCGAVLPPTSGNGNNSPASGNTPDATHAAEAAAKYGVAKVENEHGDIYIKLVMDDLYSREALIEKARQLKEQYQAKQKLSCYFFYRKYGEKLLPVAGVLYLEDCSHCQFKDKEGNPVDFPFYHLEKPAADSLRALQFDTAGYKQEAVFLSTGFKTRDIILSSGTEKALHIFQSPKGHSAFPLIKKVVDGQERFYEPEEKDSYFVINRQEGLI